MRSVGASRPRLAALHVVTAQMRAYNRPAMAPSPELPELHETAGGVELAVKVVPGASRTRVVGLWNAALRVQVAAAPEAGKANRELLKYLAKLLGCKPAALELVSGQTRPLKRVRIRGMRVAAVRAALAEALK